MLQDKTDVAAIAAYFYFDVNLPEQDVLSATDCSLSLAIRIKRMLQDKTDDVAAIAAYFYFDVNLPEQDVLSATDCSLSLAILIKRMLQA